MKLLSCEILVGGDMRNTVVRDAGDPVTAPEALLLQAIHGGPEAVKDAQIVGEVKRSAADEKARLIAKYGTERVEAVFPGRNPNMETPWDDEAAPKGGKAGGAKKATTAAKVDVADLGDAALTE